MTQQQMEIALEAGRNSCADQPVDCFIGGEMGIGNTTAAAAIFCALLGIEVDDIVGRGTGVDDAGLQRKRQAVQRGLVLHTSADTSPEEILRCLGGFEIAALVGALYWQCSTRCAEFGRWLYHHGCGTVSLQNLSQRGRMVTVFALLCGSGSCPSIEFNEGTATG